MRKLIIAMLAALAFVACEKEEEVRKSYVQCELTPQTISIPSEGGSFTVEANAPSFVGLCGFKLADSPDGGGGFGTGVTTVPTDFPQIYDAEYPNLPPFDVYPMFEGSYHIEQVDATTFNFTLLPPEGCTNFMFTFFVEGGAHLNRTLLVSVE